LLQPVPDQSGLADRESDKDADREYGQQPVGFGTDEEHHRGGQHA
jgi:hypothetical protein